MIYTETIVDPQLSPTGAPFGFASPLDHIYMQSKKLLCYNSYPKFMIP